MLWARPLQKPQCWSPRHKGCVLPQVRELIDKVRAVFVESLDELSWMDTASKKKAQEKVGGHCSAEVWALPGEGSPGGITTTPTIEGGQ